jgi:Leucine-rich repeat (LRR) protein
LPNLPQTLIRLDCYNNQLTSLPNLPPNLIYLSCYNNQLTSLPNLPPTLTRLICFDNKLTILPNLPPTLISLGCSGNQLIYLYDSKIYTIQQIQQHSQILSNFKHLYYSLRFKVPFRDLLWKRVREPNAMRTFHPNYLLDNLTEDADLETVLEKWK